MSTFRSNFTPEETLLILARWLIDSLNDELNVLQKELHGAQASVNFLLRTATNHSYLLDNSRETIEIISTNYNKMTDEIKRKSEYLIGHINILWKTYKDRERIASSKKFESNISTEMIKAGSLAIKAWNLCYKAGEKTMKPALNFLRLIQSSSLQRFQSLDPVLLPRPLLRQDEFSLVFRAMDNWANDFWNSLKKITKTNPNKLNPVIMWDYALTDKVSSGLNYVSNGDRYSNPVVISGCYFLPIFPQYQPIVGHELMHELIKMLSYTETKKGIKHTWLTRILNDSANSLVSLVKKSGGTDYSIIDIKSSLREFLADFVACSVAGPAYVAALLNEISKTASISYEMTKPHSSEQFALMRIFTNSLFCTQSIKNIMPKNKFSIPFCLQAFVYLYRVWWALIRNKIIIKEMDGNWDNPKRALNQRLFIEPIYLQCILEMKDRILRETKKLAKPSFINYVEGRKWLSEVYSLQEKIEENKIENIVSKETDWKKLCSEYSGDKTINYSIASELCFMASWFNTSRKLDKNVSVNKYYLPMARIHHEITRYIEEGGNEKYNRSDDKLNRGEVVAFCFYDLVSSGNDAMRKYLEKYEKSNVLNDFMKNMKKSFDFQDQPHVEAIAAYAGAGPSDVMVVVREYSLRKSIYLHQKIIINNSGILFDNEDKISIPVHMTPSKTTGRIIWIDNFDFEGLFLNNLSNFFKSSTMPEELLYCEMSFCDREKEDLISERESVLAIYNAVSRTFKKTELEMMILESIGKDTILLLIKNVSNINIIPEIYNCLTGNDKNIDGLSRWLKKNVAQISITPFFTKKSKCKLFDKNERGLDRISLLQNMSPASKAISEFSILNKKQYLASTGFNKIIHFSKNCKVPLQYLGELIHEFDLSIKDSSVLRTYTNVVWNDD